MNQIAAILYTLPGLSIFILGFDYLIKLAVCLRKRVDQQTANYYENSEEEMYINEVGKLLIFHKDGTGTYIEVEVLW